jgi:hypothetical protein
MLETHRNEEGPVKARHLALGTAIAAFALLAAKAAFADVIDGDWCRDDGHRFSIQGPTITTPGGQQTQGQYSRHSFRYTVPAGEQGSGQDIAMQLLNELTLRLTAGAEGTPEIWHRCKPTTS